MVFYIFLPPPQHFIFQLFLQIIQFHLCLIGNRSRGNVASCWGSLPSRCSLSSVSNNQVAEQQSMLYLYSSRCLPNLWVSKLLLALLQPDTYTSTFPGSKTELSVLIVAWRELPGGVVVISTAAARWAGRRYGKHSDLPSGNIKNTPRFRSGFATSF